MPDAPFCPHPRPLSLGEGEVPPSSGMNFFCFPPGSAHFHPFIRVGGQGRIHCPPLQDAYSWPCLTKLSGSSSCAHAGQVPGIAVQDDLNGGLDLHQVGLAGDQVGQVAALLTIVETPCLGIVVEVPDVNKVVAQVLKGRCDLLDVAGVDAGLGDREAGAGRGAANLTSMVWIPTSRPGMVTSKDIMPLPSVAGLGAGVTSRVPTLTRLMGTKDLKPSPLTVMVEPGPPLVSDRVIIPSGTSWATVVTTLISVRRPRTQPSWNCSRGWPPWWGCAAVVSNRPLASGNADTVVVLPLLASYTISNVEAAALVVLAGEAGATYHRDGSHAARLRGHGYLTRPGMSTITTPVRPLGIPAPGWPARLPPWLPRSAAGPPKPTSCRRCPLAPGRCH